VIVPESLVNGIARRGGVIEGLIAANPVHQIDRVHRVEHIAAFTRTQTWAQTCSAAAAAAGTVHGLAVALLLGECRTLSDTAQQTCRQQHGQQAQRRSHGLNGRR